MEVEEQLRFYEISSSALQVVPIWE